MAYQIFRIAKVKRQGVGGCQQEHNRTTADRGRFPSSNIDYDKTHTNKYLKKSKNYWKDIQAILKQAGIEKYRKDAVVMLDAIYTASPEAMEKMSNAERDAYFLDCCEWHEEHFGPIINAVIHEDETSIHLHINSVPICQKDGIYKLSAKDIIGNKSKLASYQTDLHEKVSKHYDLERGETKNPDENRKHLTKLEHDTKVLKSQVLNLQIDKNDAEEKYSETIKKLQQVSNEAERQENIAISLKAENKALKAQNERFIEDSCAEIANVNKSLVEVLKELGEDVSLPVPDFSQKTTQNQQATLDEIERTMSLIQRIASATKRIVNEMLKEYAPRFRNAYSALQPILDHFINKEQETYKKLVKLTEESIEIGKPVIEKFESGKNITQKDADLLKKATEGLERIVDEYEDEWER